MDTATLRPGVDDKQAAWLDGFMPLKRRNLRTMYGVLPTPLFTGTGGDRVVFFDFFNIGSTPYCLVVVSTGEIYAVNTNTNGSRDIGLMQINSGWLPVLQRHGLKEQDLYDPCVNVLIAAWILSNNFQRLGYTTQGLGAYNAVTPWKRERYARQILQSFKY
jgi:hypothetical protein